MPPGNDMPYYPVVLPKHAAKKYPWLSYIGLDYSLQPIETYYSALRMGGYVASGLYGTMANALQDWCIKSARSTTPAPPPPSAVQSSAPKSGANPRGFADLTGSSTTDPISPSPTTSSPEAARTPHAHGLSYYKGWVNIGEGIYFTSISVAAFFAEKRTLLDNASLAFAAEKGRRKSEITLWDLHKSDNPIISTAADRALWKGGFRTSSGLAFFGGLVPGVIANACLITAERTAFAAPTAYDILQKAVNDVQFHNFGEEAKAGLVVNLERVLQAERADHRREMLSREQLHALKPVLEEIADDVLDKRFGFEGMLYIMGGGVVIPEDPLQSLANYYHVRQVGVEGIVREHREIRAQGGVPTTRISDIRRDPARMNGNGHIAESARPEALRRHRREVIQQQLPGSPRPGVETVGAGGNGGRWW